MFDIPKHLVDVRCVVAINGNSEFSRFNYVFIIKMDTQFEGFRLYLLHQQVMAVGQVARRPNHFFILFLGHYERSATVTHTAPSAVA